MKRAAGTCAVPGCAGVPAYRGRCAAHLEWNGPAPRERGRRLVRRRARIMRARGRRCEQCGGPPPLELHHLDGDPANDTHPNLVLLCLDCHRTATAEQRLEVWLRVRPDARHGNGQPRPPSDREPRARPPIRSPK